MRRSARAEFDGRNQRGEVTRQRLLDAALEAFGLHGYDGVSTRALADAAGVNQAAILYHFGTKDALYAAVAATAAERARARLAPLFDDLSAAEAPGDAATAAGQLRANLAGMVRGLIGIGGDSALASFIAREQTHPGAGFEALYGGYIREIHERVGRLIAVATNRPERSAAVVVDAHAVIGMALGFALARATFLRRAEWRGFAASEVETIAARVADLACAALDLPRRRPRRSAAPAKAPSAGARPAARKRRR